MLYGTSSLPSVVFELENQQEVLAAVQSCALLVRLQTLSIYFRSYYSSTEMSRFYAANDDLLPFESPVSTITQDSSIPSVLFIGRRSTRNPGSRAASVAPNELFHEEIPAESEVTP